MKAWKMFNVFKPFLCLTTILTLFLFTSCNKDLPHQEGERLVKIIKWEEDSVGIILFNYNQNDQLVNISHTLNNKPSHQTNLFYDNAGKLQKSQEMYIPSNYTLTANYTYNNDLIVSKIATDGHATNRNVYHYNSQGQLTADTAYQSWNPYHDYKYLNYDAGQNVNEVKYFYNASGIWEQVGATSFVYNNVANPFRSLGLMYYLVNSFDPDRNIYLSKNLVTKQTNGFESHHYTYEFYSNGLPKKVVTSSDQLWGKKSSTEFFYE